MNPKTTQFVITDIDGSANGLSAVVQALAEEGIGIDLLASSRGQLTLLPTKVKGTVRVLEGIGLEPNVFDFVSIESPADSGKLPTILEAISRAGVALESCLITANHIYVGCADAEALIKELDGVPVAAI